MSSSMKKLSSDYKKILNILENLNNNNIFKSFEKKIQIQDGILNLFNTLYFLLSDIEDIKTNKDIILDMLNFKNFLNKYRLISVIQRAIELGASMEDFSNDEFMQLVDLKDKDINIVLASSKYINDDIAYELTKPPVYKVLDNLLSNDILSHKRKKEILKFLHEKENKKSITLQSLITKYKQFI